MNETPDLTPEKNLELHQEESETNKIENLRKKHREQRLAFRELQREYFFNRVRFLEGEQKNINFVGDITDLAESLKHRSLISCDLLNSIMNSLLSREENITEFLKVDGALQALLRLLSGQNEKYQLIAAQCLCNLALGNEKQSLHLLKASESYLMVHLSGRNCYIKEACTVALGNMCAHGIQNIALLMKQGFLPKVITLLSNKNANMEAAVVYALGQFIYRGFDILKSEEVEHCLLAIIPIFTKRSFLVAFVMSILSFSEKTHQHFISEGIHFEALRYLLISLREKEKESLYYLRIINNLSTKESVMKDLILNEHYILQECVSCLLHSKKLYLQKECLSWLGNILNNQLSLAKSFGVELIKENFESVKLCVANCNEFLCTKTVS